MPNLPLVYSMVWLAFQLRPDLRKLSKREELIQELHKIPGFFHISSESITRSARKIQNSEGFFRVENEIMKKEELKEEYSNFFKNSSSSSSSSSSMYI